MRWQVLLAKLSQLKWQQIVLRLIFLFFTLSHMHIEASEADVCPQCLYDVHPASKDKIISHKCHQQKKFIHVKCFKDYLKHAIKNLHENLRNKHFTPPFYFKIISTEKAISSYEIKCLNCHKIIRFPATENNIQVLQVSLLRHHRSWLDLEKIQQQETCILENIICSYQAWITEQTYWQFLIALPCWKCLERWFF
jgi:hypothetical protein